MQPQCTRPADRQLRAKKLPSERDGPWQPPACRETGLRRGVSGRRGTAAAGRQGTAGHSSLQPSPARKENQPNLQAKWPLSVESPSLPTAEVSWLARSLHSRKVIWGNVSSWDLTGPYRLRAGTGSLSPSHSDGAGSTWMPPGALLFLLQATCHRMGPPICPLQRTQLSISHHGRGLCILPPIWGTSGLRMRRVLCCQAPSD